jgi:pimeloyl-ACP methyl ester carboxylesterase
MAASRGPGAPVVLGFADTGLGQLHVRRQGSGRPIVVLPAASQSHNQVSALSRALAAAHEVVVLDLFGSGYSAPLPAGAGFPHLAAAFAEALTGLCSEPVLLYGIHTGNKIAASLAAHHPELVRGLVLCGQTHSLIVGRDAREAQMRRVSAHRFPSDTRDPAFGELRDWVSLWRELEDVWFGPGTFDGTLSGALRASIRTRIADLLLATDSLPDLYRANFVYDLEADLRRITVPTLVVEIATPHEDRVIGRQAEAVTRLVAGSSSIVFEEPDGLGLTLEDRAEDLARAIIGFESRLPHGTDEARNSGTIS